MKRFIFLFSGIFMLALTGTSFAQMPAGIPDLPTGERPQSWHIWNASALGWNQPVLGDMIKVYRKMPWGEGKTLLTCDSHARAGGLGTISPYYMRPAVMLGISPLLIMDLDVHYGPGFNVLNHKFKSFRDHYEPMKLGTPDDYMYAFHQFQANLLLKAAYWRFAVLSMNDFNYYKSKDYMFEWEAATIVKDGPDFRTKEFLLYEFIPNWRVYANYENYNYYPAHFMTELASTGIVYMRPSFHNLTVISQVGYHVHNTKYHGIKVWIAAIMEWDFPDKN